MSHLSVRSIAYKKLQSEITKRNWGEGKYDFLRKPKEERLCKNVVCANTFIVYPSDPQKFCSHKCADFFRHKSHITFKDERCIFCNDNLKEWCYKYCSNKCQNDLRYKEYIDKWKLGKVSGGVGIETKTISGHIRRYLTEKFGEKCSICGWNERNSITDQVPVEIDHIDGNSSNNKEENLRIICPNCHSLSSNYKNLNKGKGRAWRMAKYIKTSHAN